MQLYATPCLALYWHQVLQRGAAPSLNLAVCPAAARSPARSAKVPHAIALWLAVLRRPVPGWVRWQANAQQLAAVAFATTAWHSKSEASARCDAAVTTMV